MNKFKILKLLKTKNKIVFETSSLEELESEVKKINLTNFSRPYMFTSIRCEDMEGKQYALTQSVEYREGQSLPVSPEKIAKLFNL